MKNRKSLLFVLVFLVLGSVGVYQCKYYYKKWSDYRNSPWAYSREQDAKLLVSKWSGAFQDPDHVNKRIELQIFVPLSEDEREARASGRTKKNYFSTRNSRNFDGEAKVTSRLGVEEYEIYGSVGKNDFHKMHFSFEPKDEKKRVLPNFNLLHANNGKWLNDELSVTLNFGYNRADGSSYSSSADLRHSKTVTVLLLRQND